MTKIGANGEVPKDFRLMFYLPSQDHADVGAQLADGVLKGVSGVTDSGRVLMLRMFGRNRNAMLIMPGEELMRLNNLEPVDYNDPDALMDNDMALLIRIYGGMTDKERAIDRIMQAADKVKHDSVKQFLAKLRRVNVFTSDFDLSEPVVDVMDFAKLWMKAARPKVEKSYEDNKQWSDEAWLEENYGPLRDITGYYEAARAALKVIGKDFVWEGEWVVKDKTLRIPPTSRLFILGPEGRQQAFDDAMAVIKKYNLDKRYKVFIANAKRMEDIGWKLGPAAAEKLTKERFVNGDAVVIGNAVIASLVKGSKAEQAVADAQKAYEKYKKSLDKLTEADRKAAEIKKKNDEWLATQPPEVQEKWRKFRENLAKKAAKRRDKQIAKEERKEGMDDKPKKLSPDQYKKQHGKCPPGYAANDKGKCRKA